MMSVIAFVLTIVQVMGAPIDTKAVVAFSSGLTSTQYIMNGETVVYDRVFLNDHDGYDKYTGIFTCPVAGTYIFHVHAYSTNKDTVMWLNLLHNDQSLVSVSGYNSHTVGSNTVMLKLRKMDRVQIKAQDQMQFALFGLDTQVYSTFAGFMLYPDVSGPAMDSGAQIVG
ncbi:hypothetical protein DPMN_186385 [Dreissena polymorpha]|uniref:C1q domain-containing protein n=2 Tax=Dreissena polymorpha TaxID=45954 RepID=A0A9D4I6H1_DREPO|nr:hypothetical protein DPMN_186385 [Dreissena polymorpha]